MAQIKPKAAAVMTLAAISTAATSGDKVLVTGVAGKIVRVYKLYAQANGAMSVIFKDTTAGNALTGAIPVTTTAPIAVFDYDMPIFESALGGDFVVNQSTTQSLFGWLAYTQEAP